MRPETKQFMEQANRQSPASQLPASRRHRENVTIAFLLRRIAERVTVEREVLIALAELKPSVVMLEYARRRTPPLFQPDVEAEIPVKNDVARWKNKICEI
jgi:hypothetical protein